jgi:hypothetical protein
MAPAKDRFFLKENHVARAKDTVFFSKVLSSQTSPRRSKTTQKDGTSAPKIPAVQEV